MPKKENPVTFTNKSLLGEKEGPSWITQAHEFEFDGVKHLLLTGRKPGEYVLVHGQTHGQPEAAVEPKGKK